MMTVITELNDFQPYTAQMVQVHRDIADVSQPFAMALKPYTMMKP